MQARARNLQQTNQFGRPPFIGQESIALPQTGAGRAHTQPLLEGGNGLGPKALVGAPRTIARLVHRLGNRVGGPARLG